MQGNNWLFGKRSIDLARDGFHRASNLPLVGWVVVHENQIQTEGWLDSNLPHENQLAACLSRADFPKDSTLFINTNPLKNTEQLLQLATHYQIKEVQVADKINAELRQEEQWVNRRYYTFHQQHRPYIVLKWAQTADGLVARSNYDSKWISGIHARKLVHQWRSQEMAILVGKNTYRYDNPQLNVRNWSGKNPLRIVIDPEQTLDKNLNVFDQCHPTLCYTQSPPGNLPNLEYTSLPQTTDWYAKISYVLSNLYHRNVASVFVEGGAQLLSFLIQHGWWDEARIFTSESEFGEGISAPLLNENYLVEEKLVSQDQLSIYFHPRS